METKYRQKVLDITDKCKIVQIPFFKDVYVIRVSFNTSELPNPNVKLVIKSYPMPAPNVKYKKKHDSIRISIAED